MMIAILALMKGFGLSGEAVVFFMALMFLVLVGIDGLLIWQLSRVNSLAKEARGAAQLKRSRSLESDAKREQLLVEPRTSVDEDTTRILKPIYEKRTEK